MTSAPGDPMDIQACGPHLSTLDFDDAFSPTEAADSGYHFSAVVVREEVARNVQSHMPACSKHVPPTQLCDNSSVSTLDIGDNVRFSQSSPQPETSSSVTSLGLHNQFSETPLPDKDNDKGSLSQTPAESPGPIAFTSLCAAGAGSTFTAQHEPAPNVDIVCPGSPNSGFQTTDSTQSSPSSGQVPRTGRTATDVVTCPSPPRADPTTSSSSVVSISKQAPHKSGHRRLRSAGPSALEKVISKTRPTYLPPKPREEDEKHMQEWQNMMKYSRQAAEKKRMTLQERRHERERRIEDSRTIWEKEIVPDWSVVHKQPSLRKFWWRGIPTKLRASMWELAVGNALALSKDHYRTCLCRAKRALQSEVFPQLSLSLIEDDISTTLPALNLFHREAGPLYGELKEMLCAWVVSRSDEGLGYTSGAAKIAAMLLITMPVQRAFVVMCNLLERHCMRSFFGGQGSQDDVEAYYRIFDTLLADCLPKIYFNFKQHQISPSAYLIDWILPLFLDHLPFEACARIWDVLVLEGDSFIYRTALAMLAVLEPRLFFPERKELLELLKGESKTAIKIARREGVAMNGGKYEIYGVDEETLWEHIDAMDEWWKESTWLRLLERELPDL